jgi:hypothetical protein
MEGPLSWKRPMIRVTLGRALFRDGGSKDSLVLPFSLELAEASEQLSDVYRGAQKSRDQPDD